MASFTQMEIRFLKSCCYLYKKDGYKVPEGSDRIRLELQASLLASAMDKLTNVLRNDPLTAREASILIRAIHHVSANYGIDTDAFDLTAVYNRLAEIAGAAPL